MTVVSSENSIRYHQAAGLELGEYIFFSDTDGDTVWL